ncbi:SDR family oxidoreductase [Halorussus gelatinilyticus]|uniref:SDR family oxidoreductase n=1 Tax=Halorussus gelatinilyticus TaxID=2937524 RepID=A0A8U0IPH3_9EURY|nr:SDR family oxidoreductase [Halorussus gelatinilyticus]UPW02044.1 SDR family oxidoreductase [Halorussus gelatinilyticus]
MTATGSDRTVLVTGCGSGIGRRTARAFAREGWTVYATDLRADLLDPLADECETAELDVTDAERCEAVVERVVRESGGIDCLVNNAGFGVVGAVEDVSADLAREQFDVLVHGPHRLARAAVPHLREAGTGRPDSGRIVNVSSVLGRAAFPGLGTYSAAKFALEGLTDALRLEAGPEIDVVAVEPAWVRTNFEETAMDRMADGERTPAYDDVYDLYERGAALDGGPLAVAPERVAETILRVATVSDPKTRYPVGWVARTIVASRFLPDRVHDRSTWWLAKAGVRLRKWGLI